MSKSSQLDYFPPCRAALQLTVQACLSLCTVSAARPQWNTTSNRPFPPLISSFPPDLLEKEQEELKKTCRGMVLAAVKLSAAHFFSK